MLTTKSGYAVLALACLHGEENWVLVADIAARTGAPRPYLHKILHALGTWGMVKSKRGYNGGVVLARSATDINLLEVIDAVEGRQRIHRCMLGLEECTDERACPAHEFWSEKRRLIEEKLSNTTLAQVAAFERREGGRLKSVQELEETLEQS